MSQDDSDQLRVTFPSEEDKLILSPFKLDQNVTNHDFQLQEDLYSALLSRSDLDLEFKYYSLIGEHEDPISWPGKICISVNRTPLTIEDRRKPLYLKTVCRPGRNVIQITGGMYFRLHFSSYVLRLVYHPTVRSVVDILKKNRLVSSLNCIEKLKNHFATMMIQETKINISLKCPISLRRITVPARGGDCRHIQCFDLESFLKRYTKSGNLRCPFCFHTPTALDFLEVDQCLSDILTSLETVERNSGKTETEEIVMYPNGKWNPVTVELDIQEKGVKSKKKSKNHEAKIQKLRNLKTKVEKIGSVSVCFGKEFSIGTGCGGTRVYVGLHDDGSEVAVKRMLTDVLKGDEVTIGNLVELKRSDYIVNYRDFIPGDPFSYVILDLCEETLADYIERSSKEELERRGPEIIREILAGLSALHCGETIVLHRDLKPWNILVDCEGHMHLADFGVSKMLDGSQTTVSTNAKGTPCWRAAESIPKRGRENVHFNRKSDIQVVGMICFYILTKGEHPFGDLNDRIPNIAKGDPVYLDMLTDSNAKSFVSWLISHDINRRPYVEEALDHPYIRLPHGNPSKRQKTCDNPGSPASLSSMALSSVKVNPQDTIKTSNRPTPSPLGRSNSTGNVSNQGFPRQSNP